MKNNESPEKKNLRILVIGDKGVGKGHLVGRFVNNRFEKPKFDDHWEISEKSINTNGVNANALVRSIAWPSKISYDNYSRSLKQDRVKLAIGSNHAIVIVCDVTSRESFENAKANILFVQESMQVFKNAPLIVVGNKADLNQNRIVSTEEFQEFSQKTGFRYFEVSAKTGQNINEAFQFVMKQSLISEKLEDDLKQKSDMLDNEDKKNISQMIELLIQKKPKIPFGKSSIDKNNMRKIVEKIEKITDINIIKGYQAYLAQQLDELKGNKDSKSSSQKDAIGKILDELRKYEQRLQATDQKSNVTSQSKTR